MKLYHVIRPVVTLGFKIYFNKIFFIGSENIPQGKPVIYSVNHPTGFFEPTLLACVFWESEFYFITRGDMFEKPIFRRILEALLMIPIYRFRDGFENMRQNGAIMDQIRDMLSERKNIMIFSEGTTKTVKRLHPLQKGMGRMAFSNYAKYGDLDLQIVPVGVTYSDPHTPRGEVMIKVGAPIPLSNYYEIYNQNTAKGINKLTSDVEAAMRPCLVHVEREEDELLADNLFLLYRNSFPPTVFPIMERNERRLLAQREMADNLNEMPDNQRLALHEKANTYFSKLESKGIKDIAVAQPYHGRVKNLLALIIGFVPFLIGWFGHYLPNWYSRKIRKEKVPYIEFEGPVMAGVAIGGTVVQYLLLLVVGLVLGSWSFWLFVLILPFLGYYSLLYNELWKNYSACTHLNKVAEPLGREIFITALREERESVLGMVRQMPVSSNPTLRS
jgi:glycerol-3-phosphate O-acyltransferase / dihydroxyacetone phosphate acyltransferase